MLGQMQDAAAIGALECGYSHNNYLPGHIPGAILHVAGSSSMTHVLQRAHPWRMLLQAGAKGHRGECYGAA